MGVKIREKIKGSGEYWVFINHKRRRKALKVGDKKAAKKVAETIAARLKLGEPIEEKPELPTLEDYWKHFRKTYLQTAVAESTASSYKTNFTVHIVPFLGKLHLDQITPAKMEEFIADLVANKKLAKATIALVLREIDIGKRSPAVPVTPPCVRVRTRRLGGLS
jgi:integrase